MKNDEYKLFFQKLMMNVKNFIIYFCSLSLISIFYYYYLKKNFFGTINFLKNYKIGIILIIILLVILLFSFARKTNIKAIIIMFTLFLVQLFYTGVIKNPLDLRWKLIMTLLILSTLSLVCLYKKRKKNNFKLELFPKRENDLTKLVELLESEVKSILIDANWGEGKTFFINKFREKYEDVYDIIYVKANLINDRFEFRKRVIKSLNIILRKNRLLSVKLRDVFKYINIEFKGLSMKEQDEFYDLILNDLNISSLEINKKIVLIVDDLDRETSKNKMEEILNFIGEITYDFGDNFKLIALGSRNKIKNTLNIEKEIGEHFFDKYFVKFLYLSNIPFYEKIDFFIKNKKFDSEKRENIENIIKKEFTGTNIIDDEKFTKVIENISEKTVYEEYEKLMETTMFRGEYSIRNTEKFLKDLEKIEYIAKKKELYDRAYFYSKYFCFFYPEYYDFLYEKREILLKIAELNIFERQGYNIHYDLLKLLLGESTNFFISLLCENFGITNKKIQYVEELEEQLLDSKNEEDFEYPFYIKIIEYFGANYNIIQRKVILLKILKNKKITKFEKLKLINLFLINISIKYESFDEFKNEMETNESKEKNIKIDFYLIRNEIMRFIDLNLIFVLNIKNKNRIEFERKISGDLLEGLKETLLKIYINTIEQDENEEKLEQMVDYLVDMIAPILDIDNLETIEDFNIKKFEKSVKELLDKGIGDNMSLEHYIIQIESCIENAVYENSYKKFVVNPKKILRDKVREILERDYLDSKYYKDFHHYWVSKILTKDVETTS